MSVKKYFVVDNSTNIIFNCILVDDQDIQEGNPIAGVNSEENTLVECSHLEADHLYAVVGRQYINVGGVEYLQPVNPEGSSWTKDSNGVWNEIKNRLRPIPDIPMNQLCAIRGPAKKRYFLTDEDRNNPKATIKRRGNT